MVIDELKLVGQYEEGEAGCIEMGVKQLHVWREAWELDYGSAC